MENQSLILYDTNIIIEIYKGNNSIIEVLEKIGQKNIAISDVTCAELLFGTRNKKELQTIKRDLNNLNVFSINEDISKNAIALIEKFSLSNKLTLPDALIASTSIYYDVELFTLNKKDFKFIENLKLLVINKER
jgi:predicted nucleic acid-binding protein